MGWGQALRVFQSWMRSLMLSLLKFLVIPLLEHSCQLWNPWKTTGIQAIEAIQRPFTYKITEAQQLNYLEKLPENKLYSPQKCRERYIIIYIWKLTKDMVPIINGIHTMAHKIQTRKHPRHGTDCVIQYPTNINPAQLIPSIKFNNCFWASVVQLVDKISETSNVLTLKNSIQI